MGNIEIRSRIWDAITSNDPEALRSILKKYPDYINKPISSDRKSNAVTRAAYLDRPHILAVLKSLGADLNKPGDSQITGLMWASARGSIESLKFLITSGVNLNQTGPFQMNASDFGLLFGTYSSVYLLSQHGCNPSKSAEELQVICREMKTPLVKFSYLLEFLHEGKPPNEVFFAMNGKVSLINLTGEARDPNETFGSWLVSVSESEAGIFDRPDTQHRPNRQDVLARDEVSSRDIGSREKNERPEGRERNDLQDIDLD